MGYVQKEMLREKKRGTIKEEIMFSTLYNVAAYGCRGQPIKKIRTTGHAGFQSRT